MKQGFVLGDRNCCCARDVQVAVCLPLFVRLFHVRPLMDAPESDILATGIHGMHFDVFATYSDHELELVSAAAAIHERHKAHVLLSEETGGRGTLIEAVGTPVSDQVVEDAKRAQPGKRFYWIDPFDAASLNPELIGKVLQYYCFKYFKIGSWASRMFKQGFGIDKYEATLRLSNYTHLTRDQLDAIRKAVRKAGRFSRVTIEST